MTELYPVGFWGIVEYNGLRTVVRRASVGVAPDVEARLIASPVRVLRIVAYWSCRLRASPYALRYLYHCRFHKRSPEHTADSDMIRIVARGHDETPVTFDALTWTGAVFPENGDCQACGTPRTSYSISSTTIASI